MKINKNYYNQYYYFCYYYLLQSLRLKNIHIYYLDIFRKYNLIYICKNIFLFIYIKYILL